MDVDELRRLPPFAGLTDVGLQRLAVRAAELRAAGGQVLALEGDPGAGMFVLCDGNVEVELRMATSSESSPCSSMTARAWHACAQRRRSAASRFPGTTSSRSSRPSRASLCTCCASSPAGSPRRAPRSEAAPTAPPTIRRVPETKLITENRRARHDYHLLERIEAGLQLTGTEVKSLREGGAQLGQAYAEIRDGEAWLVGASISEYAGGNIANHRPERDRKLLLHRREIDSLYGKVREKGLTLVPTRLYFKDGRVKVEIALARGKERIDKRRDLAERDAKRQMERALKARR